MREQTNDGTQNHVFLLFALEPKLDESELETDSSSLGARSVGTEEKTSNAEEPKQFAQRESSSERG